MFNTWTTKKIEEYVVKLEEMYLQGIRQSTFKGQQLAFASTQEIEQRLNKAYQVLESRGAVSGQKRKKMIRFQTKNDGFR